MHWGKAVSLSHAEPRVISSVCMSVLPQPVKPKRVSQSETTRNPNALATSGRLAQPNRVYGRRARGEALLYTYTKMAGTHQIVYDQETYKFQPVNRDTVQRTSGAS